MPEESEETKTCPYCAETIKAAAIRCRYCQADLTAAPDAPQRSATPQAQPPQRIVVEVEEGRSGRTIEGIGTLMVVVGLLMGIGGCAAGHDSPFAGIGVGVFILGLLVFIIGRFQ